MRLVRSGRLAVVFCFFAAAWFGGMNGWPQSAARRLGIFEGQTDVGSVTPPGSAVYDPAAKTYTLTSAGANLWSTVDAFHFVWKKVSGDVSLTAEIKFSGAGANPHRKAILIFRKSLDADGVYVDAAQHGSGLTALQYRRERGATTQDIELNLEQQPSRLRLEKRGDVVTMFVSMKGEPLHQVGASTKMKFDGEFYAGIGLCSHDATVVEKAVFSDVTLAKPAPVASAKLTLYSTLQTISIDEGARVATVVYTAPALLQAPIWAKDGASLVFNGEGRMWKIPVKDGTPAALFIGEAQQCNGSHGFSPDGTLLAITCGMPNRPEARVYVIPAGGGTPRMVTATPYSYFHSWSPDGKTILFTRPSQGGGGNIMAIAVEGGAETALTTGDGVNDDPDYAPDGKWVYFNSNRGGTMQIWRMRPDGSGAEQMTSDEFNNWTPHPSPDGKTVMFLSYDKSETGHAANKDVALRILTPEDKKVRTLVEIVGGSGSSNVNSWAPDGRHFAFVSYQMLPEMGGN